MSIQALRAVWGTQFPLLCERVKASLFSQLAHIQDATTEAAVNEAVFLAKGFIVALLEAEQTDEQGMHLLGTTLLRIESEALARLKASRVMVDEAHRAPQFTADALQTVRDTRTEN